MFSNEVLNADSVKKSHNGYLALFIVVGKSQNSRPFNVAEDSGTRGVPSLT